MALRERHTFASTGERTFGIARCGDYIMGDEFEHDGAARYHMVSMSLNAFGCNPSRTTSCFRLSKDADQRLCASRLS